MAEVFEAYCHDIEREDKVVWGGQAEIVALSGALCRPIVVFSANAPPLTVTEGAAIPVDALPLHISYVPVLVRSPFPFSLYLMFSRLCFVSNNHFRFHEHYYGSGAHYNSVVPL